AGSPAFELVRRLRRCTIEIRAFDPLMQARDAARSTFGLAISCCDTIGESIAGTDVILVCNPDPSFANLAAEVGSEARIIDPWGCLRGPHPGLVQLGRNARAPASGAALAPLAFVPMEPL